MKFAIATNRLSKIKTKNYVKQTEKKKLNYTEKVNMKNYKLRIKSNKQIRIH